MSAEKKDFSSAVFAVGNQPYCLWGWDLPARHLQFLQGIDFDYFAYLANVHAANLDGDQRQHSATALRAAFHHGLETLFSLIGAAVQATGCVAAWILKSNTRQLRQFVENVRANAIVLNHVGLETVSWSGIAEKVLLANFSSEGEASTVRSYFAESWKHLAHEYLRAPNIYEYNSLKHGFRMRPGGFVFQVATQPPGGGQPSDSDFRTVAASDFGSFFLRAIPISGAPSFPAGQKDPHHQFEGHSLNWDPRDLVSGLKVISMSIQNICGALRLMGGEPTEAIPVFVAPPHDQLVRPWEITRGTTQHMVSHRSVAEQHIERFSKDELLARINKLANDIKEKGGTNSPESAPKAPG